MVLLVGDGKEDSLGRWAPSPICSAVGPCALEYTKMKTSDHFWTDPSADELVQRHRIHSSHLRQDSPTKRPALCVSGEDSGAPGGSPAEFWTRHGGGEWTGALTVTSGLTRHLPARCQIQKRHSSGSMDDRPSLSARDYVESLHQNSRTTLLYGKNNVLVQPVRVPILAQGFHCRSGSRLQRRGIPVAPGCSSIYPSIHSLICLFMHLPISPSLHLFTHRLVCPSIQSSIHSSVSIPPSQPVNSLPASVFTHLSVCACVHHFLSICLYLYPPSQLIHPSIYPSLHPSIHPSILLSVINSTH